MLEISSFQLETIETFHPHIAVVLNVTPDHLDRHYTFENYVAAKARIFENQTSRRLRGAERRRRSVRRDGREGVKPRRVLVQPLARS